MSASIRECTSEVAAVRAAAHGAPERRISVPRREIAEERSDAHAALEGAQERVLDLEEKGEAVHRVHMRSGRSRSAPDTPRGYSRPAARGGPQHAPPSRRPERDPGCRMASHRRRSTPAGMNAPVRRRPGPRRARRHRATAPTATSRRASGAPPQNGVSTRGKGFVRRAAPQSHRPPPACDGPVA
jgi:hypothetical protein